VVTIMLYLSGSGFLDQATASRAFLLASYDTIDADKVKEKILTFCINLELTGRRSSHGLDQVPHCASCIRL
jgi:hypothetical protein